MIKQIETTRIYPLIDYLKWISPLLTENQAEKVRFHCFLRVTALKEDIEELRRKLRDIINFCGELPANEQCTTTGTIRELIQQLLDN